MCDYHDRNPFDAIRVPNVLNNFEATISAIGVSAILLVVLLIRSLRLPSNDSSKPFLLVLSLGMALATVASIVLFLYRSCYLGREFGHISSIAEEVGTFASVNSLLFGGGLILLGACNTTPADGNGTTGCTWFFHIAIAAISVVVGTLSQMFWSELHYIPAFVFYVLPAIGFIVLTIGLTVGYCRAKKDTSSESSEKKENSPFCSLVCFLAAPVILVLAARVLDGFDVFQRALSRNIVGFHDRDDWLGIYDAIRAQPVIKGAGIEQWELFLPIIVVLSALIFHPSVRCCRSSDKSKIAPSNDETCQTSPNLIPGWSMPYPMISQAHANMIMAPQMPVNAINCTFPAPNTAPNAMMMPQIAASPSMVSFPMMQNGNHNQVPVAPHTTPSAIALSPSHPIAQAQVPAFHQHPQMHGMGGRPVYMMA